MSEKENSTGLIKNPLTVIAIFAGLAEVSATIALPQLPVDVQAIFVWFVMLFPALLVSLFFFLLWFKHQVLYAPSDFANEDNFMSHWKPRASGISPNFDEDEAITPYFDDQVSDSNLPPPIANPFDMPPEPLNRRSSVPTPSLPRKDEELGRFDRLDEKIEPSRYLIERVAEDAALRSLSRELNTNFVRDVTLSKAENVSFDAIAETERGPIFVEVVTLHSRRRMNGMVQRAISRVSRSATSMPDNLKEGGRAIIVIVSGFEISNEDRNRLGAMTAEIYSPISVELRFVYLSQLERK
jgi:hypothetical protein